MNRTTTLALALAPFLLLAACTDAAKAPAEAALKAGEAAVAGLGDEVTKLAPVQVQAAREALSNAKALAAKQDYKAALAAAGEVSARAKEAVAAAEAKKAEAAKALAAAKQAFADGTAALSGHLSAIQTKIAALGKAKKLPKGITKATLAQARKSYAALEQGATKLKARGEADLGGSQAELDDLQRKAGELAKQLQVK
jgi:hypothetical protein